MQQQYLVTRGIRDYSGSTSTIRSKLVKAGESIPCKPYILKPLTGK